MNLSYERYKELTAQHKKIYNRKKKDSLTYERFYWIDTKTSWAKLSDFFKRWIITALEDKIRDNKL